MKRVLIVFSISGFLFFSAVGSALAAPLINTLSGGLFDRQTGTAIRGYDPVAYFSENKPVKGKEEFQFEWSGAKWLFSSRDNLNLFKAYPERYAPQYGGYCAYGVAIDNLVGIEADKFTIINGKLYLNFDAGVQNTWRKSPEKYISDANAKFTALIKR